MYWRLPIQALIVIQVCFTIVDCTYQWGKSQVLTSMGCATNPEDPCQGVYHDLTYAECVFQIITDLIVSLLPIVILAELRRPRWEKVVIALLMSMGLTASAFSIWKLAFIQHFESDDYGSFSIFYDNMTCAEVFIGMIAACLFSLKAPFETLLKRVGILDVKRAIHPEYRSPEDLPDLEFTGASNTSTMASRVYMIS